MSVGSALNEDRRAVILRVLAEYSSSLNEGVLQDALTAFGHHVSRDLVRTDLHWLAEQSLLTIEQVGTIVLAKVTQRGEDVASGRARVPGVKPRRAE